MKIDPYKNKERYTAWRKGLENGISGVSKENSDIILRYLDDMEMGLNVASKNVKGGRGHSRLNNLKYRMQFFATKFSELYNINRITDISESQLIGFLSKMKSGEIRKEDGQTYKSIETFAKVFKAFWHWHQKTSRKVGIEIPEITSDLDTRQEKPDWVYLTEDQVKKIAESAKFDYKVLIYFLFDTGIRSPTELINVRVSDLFNNFKELNIREETSKTFGRRIKLMICPELLKQYVDHHKLKPEDQLFKICPSQVNRHLQRLSLALFGDKVSPAGTKYSEITMYDFRHISCCYWLPRYKSESALKYRFGWKKSDKIHYYSELLGMKDTISEEDLLVDVTKTEIEQRLTRSEKEKEMLQEKMNAMQKDLQIVIATVQRLERVKKIDEIELRLQNGKRRINSN